MEIEFNSKLLKQNQIKVSLIILRSYPHADYKLINVDSNTPNIKIKEVSIAPP
jgi:hypothetical protein